MTTTDTLPEGATCQPNISAAGRRRRRSFALGNLVIAAAMLGAFVAVGTPWYWRLSTFLPVAGALVGWLQASRHTCVKHARAGTFENEDFSTRPASDDEVAASRRVASGILRDAMLGGALVAVLSAVTAFAR